MSLRNDIGTHAKVERSMSQLIDRTTQVFPSQNGYHYHTRLCSRWGRRGLTLFLPPLPFSPDKASNTQRGSFMLALTYTINALNDHLPSRCITSGLAPIAANLAAPPFLPVCSANFYETSRAFSPPLSFSHVSATTDNPRR